MFCQTCPQKPFCSHLCPEAEAYVRQDHQTAREFFSFPEAKYSPRSEELERLPSLSKTEWKIVTLLKKGLTRKQISEILEVSRPNLRRFLLKIKRKGHAFGPDSD